MKNIYRSSTLKKRIGLMRVCLFITIHLPGRQLIQLIQLAGEFGCEVTDWNRTERRAVHVHVIPVPHMEVTPLSSTLTAGSPVAITCLSRDDEFALFSYTWKRNGDDMIRGANEEVVEQLLPTGSRLSIPSLKEPAVYTCTITSQAGSISDDAYVAVLNGMGRCSRGLSSIHAHNIYRSWSHVQFRILQRSPMAIDQWGNG